MKYISVLLDQLLNSREELSSHSKEVSILAYKFGVYLGLGLRDVNNLRIGGLIHDIGKLEIPEDIMFKIEQLTDEEFVLIKSHPNLGYEKLINTKNLFSKDVLDIVLQHHERIDGFGYPQRIKDKEINKLAKIVSLCDVYSAISNVRSYKNRNSAEYALLEIEKGLGTQFDAHLGRQFIVFIENVYLKEINPHSSIL